MAEAAEEARRRDVIACAKLKISVQIQMREVWKSPEAGRDGAGISGRLLIAKARVGIVALDVQRSEPSEPADEI